MTQDPKPPILTDLADRVQHLVQIGRSLSREKNLDRLLEHILLAAKEITNADGGTLYRVTEDAKLKFEIIRNDSLGIAMGGTTGSDVPFRPLNLFDSLGQPINSLVAAYAVHNDCSVNIADAYSERGFDFSGTKEFDKNTGYRSKSFLTVPMKDHDDQVIGVLQLINGLDPNTGTVIEFSAANQLFVESLASQAAIALSNRLLIERLETLFESFINMINTAIDDKSAYTMGHCGRVPVLTMLLADAVNDTTIGPLRDFTMTEDDRHELKLAGLMHDCGKITTPIHVIDKGTKLETISDRVHLLDTRFEVIRRDIELDGLRTGKDAGAVAMQISEMEQHREFLHHANIGGEFMTDEDVDQVHAISKKYRWTDPSGKQLDFLTDDEVKNLSIRRGTLTQEERATINHHAQVTIDMLEAMPWPKHLQHVPEYAGGHHERMDGTGYPRGLTRDQMSVPARCMAIADIFEALTARDRPYKKGKTLSEALTILGKMKLTNHIDPDLFDVFIHQGVYLRYAKTYLEDEQIDEVQLDTIPGYSPLSAAK
jgi:HD-GYP domain-containing protein (c-di-GMP phosphodiesterase class II)